MQRFIQSNLQIVIKTTYEQQYVRAVTSLSQCNAVHEARGCYGLSFFVDYGLIF